MKKVLGYLLLVLVLLVGSGVAYVYLRPTLIISKEKIKQEYALPNSHFLKWRGGDVHYVDEGSGPVVLMIHGFGGHFRNFQKLAEEMKGQYRVIRVDLPGFGLSDCPPVDKSNPQFVKLYDDFSTFLIDTLHLDSMYVIGNSMGGMIAWNMAVKHPQNVQKLVLLASAGYDLDKTAKGLFIIKYKAFTKMFEKGMPLFVSKGNAGKCYADESKIDQHEVAMNNDISNREGNLQHLLDMAGDKVFPDTALIQQVKCPTLIIWGEKDRIIPVEHAQRFKRDIPNSRLILYDTCGHVPMIEMTDRTKQDIEQFFNE